MVGGRVLVLVLTLVTAIAHADSPKLDRARAAIDAVHYDEAQTLLVGALEEGGNSPRAVAELYRLSASTAIVLGQVEVAEQYYRRWLALEPTATLAADLAPKLRAPFVSAQAYMAAHGHLTVKATQVSPAAIDVVVESDPLAMAVAVVLDGGPRSAIGADHHAQLKTTPGTPIAHVAIVDEFGNHLVDIEGIAPSGTIAPPAPPPAPPPAKLVAAKPTALVLRWQTWVIPAVALLGVGVAFGHFADNANDDLSAIIDASTTHVFGDADAARSRRDRDAALANGFFVATAACTLVAVYLYTQRPQEPAIVPAIGAGQAGVMVTGSF